MFAVGDIVASEDLNCWGDHSKYIHFGRVRKITPTGQFCVEILDHVRHMDHAQTIINQEQHDTVVTPGPNIMRLIHLTPDGIIRDRYFGSAAGHAQFERYDPHKVYVEAIDMCGQ